MKGARRKSQPAPAVGGSVGGVVEILGQRAPAARCAQEHDVYGSDGQVSC